GLGGMPEFRAPEVVRYERYGQSSDMYSMAGLMGMMFTENPNRFIDLKLTFGDYFEIDQDRDDYKKILAAATTPYNFESMFEGIGSGIDEGLKSNMCAFGERMGDPNEANRPSSEEAAQYFTSLCEVYELKNTAQAPDLLKKFLSDFSQAAPAKIAEEKPVSPSPR
ncbi:MAG TPA: hypothetical protein VLH77_06125, partial [Gammaproteobacteria bacterium]|nr:hypothetical protein [Gammaproteobacteria bacterium]